jgi:radical SAM protein with 4Fe4S-binding SPASM domain
MSSIEYSTANLISILVEITTYCNMKCSGCIRTIKKEDNRWLNHHIKVSDFTKIVESLPNADEIVTQGIGEPTMHPYLPELIRIARESGKFQNITLTSNAMARDAAYYSQLFRAGLTRLYISVDSFDPVLADRLRAGTKVGKLKRMISGLTEAFSGQIAIRTVIGSANIHTVPDILAVLNGLGKLQVYMHPYDDIGYPEGTLTLEERAQFMIDIEAYRMPFSNLKVVANGFVPAREVCVHPWKIPAITVDGYLVPCCRVMDKNIFNFGNVVKHSFEKVWNAEKSNNMRKEFFLRSPNYCEGCTRYEMRT